MAKIPNSLRNLVRKRAHNSCEKCGANIRRNKAGFSNGSVHHRLPRRLGGPDTITNLVLVCLTCHRAIHRDEDIAAQQGWMVWGDPDVTPVLRQGRGHGPGWVLLVPDGGLEYLSHREGSRLCSFLNRVTQAA
jgi:hypothetical protein